MPPPTACPRGGHGPARPARRRPAPSADASAPGGATNRPSRALRYRGADRPGAKSLPNTLADRQDAWDDPAEIATAAAGEQAVLRALALARRLAGRPRRHDPLATAAAAVRFLGPLGAGAIDRDRFAAWREAARLAPGRDQPGKSLP